MKDDDGSAIVEFITFGLSALLLISVSLSGIFVLQRAAFTAQSAVREGTRAFVTASSDSQAFESARVAASLVFSDSDMNSPQVRIECSSYPCLTPGGEVKVSVLFPVDLTIAHFTIRASHREKVSPWK